MQSADLRLFVEMYSAPWQGQVSWNERELVKRVTRIDTLLHYRPVLEMAQSCVLLMGVIREFRMEAIKTKDQWLCLH
jgi:hypothetical protein